MKNEQHIGKRLLKAVVNKIAEKEYLEWPPGCHGFIYQSMRPVRQESRQKEKQ